jgi:NTE family protein
MDGERALVLGGGGLAGIAWQTGVLFGLAEAGVDVTDADLVIGTSAGSSVAAQLGSGLPPGELFERQADAARQTVELAPRGPSLADLLDTMTELAGRHPDPAELRRAVGELALAADTVDEPARRAVIAARLPVHRWPDRAVSVVAVDARTGEPVVFDSGSGVELVDAVAASCAVPGVWPPVTIGGCRYIDGAIRSMANADLAGGYQRVLVVAPIDEPSVHEQLAALPGRSALITPDEQAVAAFGSDVLDPAMRTPAARAGRAQGMREAVRVGELWHPAA